MNERKPFPAAAIVGPTAVGKTALSLLLAERLGAEIISVDSRQVYRFLDVGADKISPEIRKKITHHLIDVVDPDEVFSAADFVARSRDAVKRIRDRGRIPLFVGGTPFYYEALSAAFFRTAPRRTRGSAGSLRSSRKGKGTGPFTTGSPSSTRRRRRGCTSMMSAGLSGRWR